MTVEMPLKKKYRERKAVKSHTKSNHGGNSGKSAGKHTAHPSVHAFRRNGYKVEGKWNVHQAAESKPVSDR